MNLLKIGKNRIYKELYNLLSQNLKHSQPGQAVHGNGSLDVYQSKVFRSELG